MNLVLATGDGDIYSGFNFTAFFHFSHLIALWSRYQNLCWPHPGGLKPVDTDLSFNPCAPTSKSNISTNMTIHTRRWKKVGTELKFVRCGHNILRWVRVVSDSGIWINLQLGVKSGKSSEMKLTENKSIVSSTIWVIAHVNNLIVFPATSSEYPLCKQPLPLNRP